MATIYVKQDTNYSDLVYGAHDYVYTDEGATHTINTSTDKTKPFLRLGGNISGKTVIENDTNQPIFIYMGSGSDTVSPYVFVSGAATIDVRGGRIELGVSDGTPNQSFTLPTDATGEKYDVIATLEVVDEDGEVSLYNWAPSRDIIKGNQYEGRHFIHDTTTNTVTFGDGTHGYIPPAGMTIYVWNIQFRYVGNMNRTAQRFRTYTSTSGTLLMDKCLLSDGAIYVPNAKYAKLTRVGVTGWLNHDRALATFHNQGTINAVYRHIGVSGNNRITCQIDDLQQATVENLHVSTFYNGNTIISNVCSLSNIGRNVHLKNITSLAYYGEVQRGALLLTRFYGSVDGAYASGTGYAIYITYSTPQYLKNMGYNGSPRHGDTMVKSSGVRFVGVRDTFLENIFCPFTSKAEGGLPSTYAMMLDRQCDNVVCDGFTAYMGRTGDYDKVGWRVFYRGGSNITIANVIVHGTCYREPLYQETTTQNGQLYNMFFVDPGDHGGKNKRSNNLKTQMVYCAQGDNYYAPANEGIGVRSISNYTHGGDRSKGSIEIRYAEYEPIIQTSQLEYDNVGYMRVNNAGDKFSVESDVIYGVTSITAFSKLDYGSSNSTYEFQLKTAGGEYKNPPRPATVANLQQEFINMEGYSLNIGFVVKIYVTIGRTNSSNYFRWVRLGVNFDANYRYPYVPPTLEDHIRDLVEETHAITHKTHDYALIASKNTTPL